MALSKAATRDPVLAQNNTCLACHAQTGVRMRFKDGSEKSVALDPKAWDDSTHGKALSCLDCHHELGSRKHPSATQYPKFASAKEYSLQHSRSCEHCHAVYYSRVQDSIHSKLLKAGNDKAPTCTDCHNPHTQTSPANAEPRTRQAISHNCGRCHSEVYTAYKTSVHGQALEKENNPDVPVCTDCHSTHSITDPRTTQFHSTSYELCGKCHEDEKKMAPYGLTTNVLSTYLSDFHGASNRLYKTTHQSPKQPLASCTDCHGIHDIKERTNHDSAHVRASVRERVILTCRKCHEGVTPEFADAWLSHYPPTLSSAPLVWAVKAIFGVINPLLISFCLLNILVNLWRVASRRRRPTYKPF